MPPSNCSVVAVLVVGVLAADITDDTGGCPTCATVRRHCRGNPNGGPGAGAPGAPSPPYSAHRP